MKILKNKLKGNFFVLPCGVNSKELKSTISAKKDNWILYVGRFDWNKGHELLIYAIKKVVKKHPDVRVFLVGHVSKREIFLKIKNLVYEFSIQKNVKLYPDLSLNKLKILYKKCSIFVFPSLIEDFGMVNLEAMAARILVIATRVGGVSKVVKTWKNGILVNPNAEELAEKICLLLENKKLRKKLAKNAIKYTKNFDWQILVNKLIYIYQKIY